MTPQEVTELSCPLDEALALGPARRESWLAALEQTKPETAGHLRSMLAQTTISDTTLLPKLPRMDDDAIAQVGACPLLNLCDFRFGSRSADRRPVRI